MPIETTVHQPINAQSSRTAVVSRRLLLCLSATLVVAVAAHISFPLPFTPVPFTLQPLAVLGVGLALGPIAGAGAMLAYLAEGSVGLPVFSPTGIGGIAQLFGPTGGYLLSYPLVAFVAGLVSQRLVPRVPPFLAALLACALATTLPFVSGASYLAAELHLGLRAAWLAGIAPFLPGELVKVFAAAGIFSALTGSHHARLSRSNS